jgi:hypothetical protein
VNNRWYWWNQKYAPGETQLEKLEKDVREGRKGLWVDPTPVTPGSIATHGVGRTQPCTHPVDPLSMHVSRWSDHRY